MAINDVSLLRSSPQTAKIRIIVDGVMRMEELICDGVLVASPAGSTAYNNALGGPILPLGAELLALTPISAFRPRRWRGALLPMRAKVTFEVLEPEKRHVGVSADFAAVTDVASVTVGVDPALGPAPAVRSGTQSGRADHQGTVRSVIGALFDRRRPFPSDEIRCRSHPGATGRFRVFVWIRKVPILPVLVELNILTVYNFCFKTITYFLNWLSGRTNIDTRPGLE